MRRRLFFIVSVFLILTFYLSSLALSAQVAYTKGTNVNLRSQAGTKYSTVAVLKNKGMRLAIIDKKKDWYKVLCPNGKQGWIAEHLIKLKDVKTSPYPSGVQIAYTKGTNVNLRSQAGTKYSQVAVLKNKGMRLAIIDKKKGWYKVLCPNGKQGWIAEHLIKLKDIKTSPYPSNIQIAYTKGTNVNLRSQVGTKYSRVAVLKNKGMKLAIVDKKKDWYKVLCPNGKQGWIAGHLIKLKDAGTSPYSSGVQIAYTKGTNVNLRSDAGTKYSQVAVLKNKGMKLAITDKKKDWYKVICPNGKQGWVAGWLVKSAPRKETAPSLVQSVKAKGPIGKGSGVVQTALGYRGVRYRWGGLSSRGFDCSGFVNKVFRQHGVHLPRSAREIYRSGSPVSSEELRPGDLVFFHTTRPGISHVGIYIGGGKFIHSSSVRRVGVKISSLAEGYYSRRFVGARRIR